jgi:2-dehydro-3-deoxyglucarate aldolase/4-hydroxy-2-oxoheptanedioate aldolase
MKVEAIKSLKKKLAAGAPVRGLWVTLESPSITEIAVGLGLDWVVIDAEHGHLDWKDLVGHLRATVRSETVALVRISHLDVGLVKRALDIGADGVVVPAIGTAEELETAVQYAQYPPRGVRGVGAERATCWGQCFAEHVGEAGENVMVVPLIESVTAGRNIDAMLRVKGVDLFLFGPADYSASAGFAGQWEGGDVGGEILAVKDRIVASGRFAGIVARNAGDLKLREEQGFRFLGLGLDAGLLISSIRQMLPSGGASRLSPGLAVPTAVTQDLVQASQTNPLQVLPENFRPTRREVMTRPGAGRRISIEPGVDFECLVGAHNNAQELTTGIVTFSAKARLPYHVHAFGESVTVLEGTLLMDVEGRRYRLGPLDNITIPRGIAHAATNPSGLPVTAHIAMASTAPTRDLVEGPSSLRSMPEDSSGMPGSEHVVRFASARRYEAGPNTQFIDHLNSRLIPDIEMSGGYGLFHKGGRLPAHIHDFDESICIIRGLATCNVEGRLYPMSDLATALQPRGRVHYFINNEDEPMAMLWVYAGPMPERIMIDEKFTEPGANPWP